MDLRDKGILYAYIKESLWDVLVKSQDQCLERLVNLQYSDLTGSGPNPNVYNNTHHTIQYLNYELKGLLQTNHGQDYR